MESKIFTKSVKTLIIVTLLIMAFFKGNLCDWLLIINGAVWLAFATFCLIRQSYKRQEEPEPEKKPEEKKKEPEESEEDPEEEPKEDPTKATGDWYRMMAKAILTDAITDLNTRGFKRLEITEEGNIMNGTTCEETLARMPEKSAWNTLADVIREDGLNVSISGDLLVVTW